MIAGHPGELTEEDVVTMSNGYTSQIPQ